MNPKLLVAMLIGLFVLMSCAHVKDASRAAAHDGIDCASAEAVKVAKEWSPSLDLLLQRSTADNGSIDMPTLDTATKSLSDIAWCAVEKTFSRAIALTTKAIDTGSSPLSSTPEQLKGTLDALHEAQHRPLYKNAEPSS